MRTVASVVGARPQFVKLAPVCRAYESLAGDVRHHIIHTGQHYDHEMSGLFFEELEIPRPDVDLGIGSGPHGRQTASMLAALEAEFERSTPDVVIVYGDTNSTLAAALAAAKLHLPLCHVEAGLRSFDRTMPEEINRVVADHCADRLYPPTPTAMANLAAEGLQERGVLAGDVMLDAVRFNAKLALQRSDVLKRHGLEGLEFGIVTVHRASNTSPEYLPFLYAALERLADRHVPLLFPMHPRTRAVLDGHLPTSASGLLVIEPLGHLDMLRALTEARFVVTDSGGLQKEAAILGTPCITLRDTTEWTETVEMGANVLVGRSPSKLEDAVRSALDTTKLDWQPSIRSNYGDGQAALSIVGDIENWSVELG